MVAHKSHAVQKVQYCQSLLLLRVRLWVYQSIIALQRTLVTMCIHTSSAGKQLPEQVDQHGRGYGTQGATQGQQHVSNHDYLARC